MTEAEFQAQAEDALRQAGALWHRCPDSRRCHGPRGLPDLIVLGPSGLLLAELKGPGGDLFPAQRAWRWAALAAGLRWETYWPDDLGRLMRDVTAGPA